MSPATLINISRLWLHWKTLLGAKWWWWWSLVRSWCDRGVPWAHMTTSYPLTSDHWLWAHLTLLTISSYSHPRHSQLYHTQLQLEKAFQWHAHIAHSMACHLWMYMTLKLDQALLVMSDPIALKRLINFASIVWVYPFKHIWTHLKQFWTNLNPFDNIWTSF